MKNIAKYLLLGIIFLTGTFSQNIIRHHSNNLCPPSFIETNIPITVFDTSYRIVYEPEKEHRRESILAQGCRIAEKISKSIVEKAKMVPGTSLNWRTLTRTCLSHTLLNCMDEIHRVFDELGDKVQIPETLDEVHIRVLIQPNTNTIEFQIEDNGEGIPNEILLGNAMTNLLTIEPGLFKKDTYAEMTSKTSSYFAGGFGKGIGCILSPVGEKSYANTDYSINIETRNKSGSYILRYKSSREKGASEEGSLSSHNRERPGTLIRFIFVINERLYAWLDEYHGKIDLNILKDLRTST